MFEKLGHVIFKRRKSAVILFIVGILVAGGFGSLAFSRLDSGGYSDPNSDSYKVYEYLTEELKLSDPAVVIIVDSGATDVTDPVVAQKGVALEKKIAQEEGVTKTLSYWTSGGEATLKSSDGKAAYILVYGNGEAFTPESQELGKRLQQNYDGEYDGLTLYAGGVGVIGHAITKKISDDLKIAELISIPLTFILLVLVFGALAASAMPLIVGVAAILGAFFILYLFTLFTRKNFQEKEVLAQEKNNLLIEKGKGIEVVQKLGFSKCKVSVAVPKTFEYNSVQDLANLRVATSYPNTVNEYFSKFGLTVDIHQISGSVEIAPNIGLADAIVDIVSSGSTLFKNGLKEVEVILKSEAVLAVSPKISNEAKQLVDKLQFRIQSVLRSRKSKYILMNVPNDKISEISKILPVLKSPTVMPLAEEGWSSVHSVIDEDKFWEVIDQLKEAGAEGILVCPIEKMVL